MVDIDSSYKQKIWLFCSDKKWNGDVAYPFVKGKLFSSIQMSSTNLYISALGTPGSELSIWCVYVKKVVFQISDDCLLCLFIMLELFLCPLSQLSLSIRDSKLCTNYKSPFLKDSFLCERSGGKWCSWFYSVEIVILFNSFQIFTSILIDFSP